MIINRIPVLRTPGPTPVPERIKQAMSQDMIGHRSGTFSQLYKKTSARLKPIFGTEEDVFILSGSGTLALESAVINMVQPGEEVVVVVTGAFGARFAEICEVHGITTHRLDIPWGEACQPDALRSLLKEKNQVKAVFMTHCETSTGVLNPISHLAKVVREETDALVIVDAVSSLAGVPVNMDDNKLDIVVSGSQKAFMLPPGLAFISVSQRAWSVIEKTPIQSFYLNLRSYRENAKKGMTSFTPAVSLMYGLNTACQMIEEEGLQAVFHRHVVLRNMTRAAFKALGLTLLTDEEDGSPTVTAVKASATLDTEALRQIARDDFQLVLAGGQKKLKGQLFRIGHMGACTPAELLQSLLLLELSLYKVGTHSFELGTAVKAAEEVLIHEF